MAGGTFGVGAFVLAVGFGLPAVAQGVVPGGWASQFGYQTFGTTGGVLVGPSPMGPGLGGPGFWPVGVGGMPSTYGGFYPFGPRFSPTNPSGFATGFGGSSGRTVNAMDPLIGSIRQAARRRGR